MLECKLMIIYNWDTHARELCFWVVLLILKNHSSQLRNVSLDPKKEQQCSPNILVEVERFKWKLVVKLVSTKNIQDLCLCNTTQTFKSSIIRSSKKVRSKCNPCDKNKTGIIEASIYKKNRPTQLTSQWRTPNLQISSPSPEMERNLNSIN